jgi:magnesium transporter
MNPHTRLGAAFLKNHAAPAARVLENFPADSVARHLSIQYPSDAVPVIEHFTPAFAASCLATLETATAARLLSLLNPELQITLLRQLEHNTRESLLNALQPDLAVTLRRRLPYAEGTAGALMEAPLASVPEELTVRNALKRIKRIRQGMKFYVYVTNTRGQLTGVLTLHELITSQPARSAGQVMHRQVVSLSPEQSIRSIINSPYWQEYHAMPVTDENSLLLGVIRQKSLRRFQEHAAQVGTLGGALATLITVGELFSVTAGHLLTTLVATATPLTRRDRHD